MEWKHHWWLLEHNKGQCHLSVLFTLCKLIRTGLKRERPNSIPAVGGQLPWVLYRWPGCRICLPSLYCQLKINALNIWRLSNETCANRFWLKLKQGFRANVDSCGLVRVKTFDYSHLMNLVLWSSSLISAGGLPLWTRSVLGPNWAKAHGKWIPLDWGEAAFLYRMSLRDVPSRPRSVEKKHERDC